MHRKNQIRVENLTRFLSYILGHRPDEFGLLPDAEGFITYKELLWAIHEESGWGYVKEGDIREVLMGTGRALFETGENRIRALDRRWQFEETAQEILPSILYFALRKRAHAHAMEKGLSSERRLLLSADPEFALRMGRRRDPKPVLLEILTKEARQRGVVFTPFGDLYLAGEIPADCISGPPVEEEPFPRKETKAKEEKPQRKPDFMPGSFLLDPQRDPAPHRAFRGKKAKGWKEDARRLRKKESR
jgi:putative RNA 2'-phosphotransferase